MQFLNQHTSKYQKRSKHFVCTRFPGSSMFCIGTQANVATAEDEHNGVASGDIACADGEQSRDGGFDNEPGESALDESI